MLYMKYALYFKGYPAAPSTTGIEENSHSETVEYSVLMIKRVSKVNIGIYTCIATNHGGLKNANDLQLLLEGMCV